MSKRNNKKTKTKMNPFRVMDEFSWGDIVKFEYREKKKGKLKSITGVYVFAEPTGGGACSNYFMEYKNGKPTKKVISFHALDYLPCDVKFKVIDKFNGVLRHIPKIGQGSWTILPSCFDKLFVFECGVCKKTLKTWVDIRDNKRFAQLSSPCDVLSYKTRYCPYCGSKNFKETTNWPRNIYYQMSDETREPNLFSSLWRGLIS